MADARVAAPLAGPGALAPPGSDLVLAQWRDEGPAGVRMAPLHVHHRDDEAWYVLDGALGVRLGEEEGVARAGDAILAPRGTPHTFWNAGPGPVSYVLVMTARIHDLIVALHARDARDPEAVADVFARHASALVDGAS